ncbi:DoxX family protein [Acinetobacter sp. HR7]|uniref:DoxX family protein n=1 Tax=Acinetobacter sp. HR7 TaxID=1509403 RepID=UPI0005373BCC|nr:DoxX family protein [Acinetobacter sp. HR7]KGT46864.1 hypothetical protein GW12_20470 [Acinetobacter sp. HR7]
MLNPDLTLQKVFLNSATEALINFVARVFISFIFIGSAWMKIQNYDATAGYMESFHVPSELLPLSILLVGGGGLALLFGVQARLAALALAVFTFICGFIFHGSGTPDDNIHLMKNVAMTGGLLFVFLHGAGQFSLDHLMTRKITQYRRI